jgi:hypothetical protein
MTAVAVERAPAAIAPRLAAARALASRLAGLVDQPDAFVAALSAGYTALADADYLALLRRTTPGLGEAYGIRAPLAAPVQARVRRACRRQPDVALWLAERLAREPQLEVSTLACAVLRVSMETDPERSWQLVRRLSRQARNRIVVDTLASVAALGILLEPYRWAELEQLVYSASPWERRLAAAAAASLPLEVVPGDRHRLTSGPALDLVAQLLGDADPDVQKAIARALRAWYPVDPGGVARFLADEAGRAAAAADGNRGWVLRNALSVAAPENAAAIRARLAGLRRNQTAPPTSRASRAASAFADLLRVGAAMPGAAAAGPERSITE